MKTIRIPLPSDQICSEGKIVIELCSTIDNSYKGYDIESFEPPSLFVYMIRSIEWLRHSGNVGTANNYMCALNSLQRFRKGEDIALREVNNHLMLEYESYLKKAGIKLNTISFYMRTLRAVYNKAVEENFVSDTKPFRHVFTGIEHTNKRALSTMVMKKIRDADIKTKTLLFARDMFLLSFYTRGMSFVDMAYLKKSDICDGVLTYTRRKTGQLLSMKWERCMQEIVDCHPAENGVYLLPIIKDLSKDPRKQYKNSQHNINVNLRKLSEQLSLDANLTMYVARHSWASIAMELDIPIKVISEGMGHTSPRTTQIYLKEMERKVIDSANSMVMEAI